MDNSKLIKAYRILREVVRELPLDTQALRSVAAADKLFNEGRHTTLKVDNHSIDAKELFGMAVKRKAVKILGRKEEEKKDIRGE